MKWPAADQDLKTVDDKDILWNQFLLTEVISKVMVELVLYGIQEGVDPEVVYSLIPNESLVQPEWKPVLKNFYKHLFTKAVFFCPVGQGRWLSVTEAVFDTSSSLEESLSQTFLAGNVNLVNPPTFVLEALRKYTTSQLCSVKPALMRKILRGNAELCRQVTADNRCTFLQYILSDNDYKDLVGVEDILPLADGSLTGFRAPTNDCCAYLASEDVINLLPGAENKFLQMSALSEVARDILDAVARSGIRNLLRSLTVLYLVSLLLKESHMKH